MCLRRRLIVPLYLLLCAALVVAGKVSEQIAGDSPSSFWVGRVFATLVLSAAVLVTSRAWGRPSAVLGLGAPPPATWAVVLVAGGPAATVAFWYGATDAFAPWWTSAAAMLMLRIVIQQAWFEEFTARGLLLGALRSAGLTGRRCIWTSAVAFGFMHLLQFLYPPVTIDGVINGVILILLTIPLGAALALLTLRAGSIWPAVVLHGLVDLSIVPQKLQTPSVALIALSSGVVPPLIVLAWWWRTRSMPRPGLGETSSGTWRDG